MICRLAPLAIGLLLAAAVARPAAAWEAETTHAGIAEQAALSSDLHRVLVERFGFASGLLSQLAVPPQDAPELFVVLHRLLNPTHGYVPDARGRLHALGWLVAGSVVADTPNTHAANHFFDPGSGNGLTDATLSGVPRRLRLGLLRLAGGGVAVRSGTSAPDWAGAADNPMGIGGFYHQYASAVSSPNPAARARHLAGALLAAGAVVHILADMGSPSHVRDDLAAHYDRIGRDPADLGSRFERVAALAYGRLGVPPPPSPVSRPTLRAYFTADDGEGLADRTAARFFSLYTLPRPFELPANANRRELESRFQRALVRAQPGPGLQFRAGDRRLVNQAGVCLADVHSDRGRVSFSMSDECALEQLAVILPEVAGYAAGLVDHLFRGAIDLEPAQGGATASAAGVDFGTGRLIAYFDDERGLRTEYARQDGVRAAAGAALARLPAPPAGARRIAVLYEGTDATGERLLATGQLAWPPR